MHREQAFDFRFLCLPPCVYAAIHAQRLATADDSFPPVNSHCRAPVHVALRPVGSILVTR